jgi:ATP-dependent Clp protease ATP-binding subunit ClpA
MRLLTRRQGARSRAKTIRPAERYLTAGADEARRLGCSFVGTEHVLLSLAHDRAIGSAALLGRLGADPAAVESGLAPWLGPTSHQAKIDPDALASLGIDFDAVRARIEGTFGPGALERASASCLGIAPRLKLALAHALDHAGDSPLRPEHVLLGILSVPDSVGARALGTLGISAEAVRGVLPPEPPR